MPSRTMFIIRIALITGVFLFAGVSLVQRAQGSPQAAALAEALPIGTLRYVLWGLVAVSAAAALFLRTRSESAPSAQRRTLTIVGWTLGEGVALFGIVIHFAGGPVSSLALGLFAFVFSLVLLPVPN